MIYIWSNFVKVRKRWTVSTGHRKDNRKWCDIAVRYKYVSKLKNRQISKLTKKNRPNVQDLRVYVLAAGSVQVPSTSKVKKITQLKKNCLLISQVNNFFVCLFESKIHLWAIKKVNLLKMHSLSSMSVVLRVAIFLMLLVS